MLTSSMPYGHMASVQESSTCSSLWMSAIRPHVAEKLSMTNLASREAQWLQTCRVYWCCKFSEPVESTQNCSLAVCLIRELGLDSVCSCLLLFTVPKYSCEQSYVPTNIHKQQIWALARSIYSENKTCFLIKWHSFWEKAIAHKEQIINMGTDIIPRDWSQHSARKS